MIALRFAATCCVLTILAGFANAEDLAGTSWRLVQIQSMNDTIDRPDDPSKYSIEFLAGGRVSVLADCNRGTGTWTSEGSGLRFGLIASTEALCPPGSISENYLAQFPWVRSYVIKDGHLFLATMADGSIIEFEPVGDDKAAIPGENIRISDAGEL